MDRTCETWLERETREAFREVKGLPRWALRAMRFEPFAERHDTCKGGEDAD